MSQKYHSPILACILMFFFLALHGKRQRVEKYISQLATRACDGAYIGDRQIILVRHQRDDKEGNKDGLVKLTSNSRFTADLVGRKLAAHTARKWLLRLATPKPTSFYFLKTSQVAQPAPGLAYRRGPAPEWWQIDESANAFFHGFDQTVDSLQAMDIIPGMTRIVRGFDRVSRRVLMRRQELSTEELNEALFALVHPESQNSASQVAQVTEDIIVVASQEYIAQLLTQKVFDGEDGPAPEGNVTFDLMSFGRKLFQGEPTYTLADVEESWGDQMYRNAFILMCVDNLWAIEAFPYSETVFEKLGI